MAPRVDKSYLVRVQFGTALGTNGESPWFGKKAAIRKTDARRRRCFENNLTFFVPGRQRSGWYQPCLPVCSIAPIQAELNEFFDTFSSGHCSLTKLSFDKKFRLVISHEFYEPSVHRLVSSADLAARALLAWSVVRLIVLVVAYLLSVVRILGHK